MDVVIIASGTSTEGVNTVGALLAGAAFMLFPLIVYLFVVKTRINRYRNKDKRYEVGDETAAKITGYQTNDEYAGEIKKTSDRWVKGRNSDDHHERAKTSHVYEVPAEDQ